MARSLLDDLIVVSGAMRWTRAARRARWRQTAWACLVHQHERTLARLLVGGRPVAAPLGTTVPQSLDFGALRAALELSGRRRSWAHWNTSRSAVDGSTQSCVGTSSGWVDDRCERDRRSKAGRHCSLFGLCGL